MATYAKEHPLRVVIIIATVLAMFSVGMYAATAYAQSGGAKSDDRGAATNVSDDPAGHDHGGAINVSDDPPGDDRGGATNVSDDPPGDDRGGATTAAGRGQNDNDDDGSDEQEFKVKLHELNGSGVSGNVQLKFEDGVLRVKVRARGLEPNQVHMQHIHGLASGSPAVCPPPAADSNGDGLISLAEGLPYFGPVLRALFLQGSTIYPTADSRGRVRYQATFSGADLGPLELMSVPLENRVVVLHGLTIGGAYNAGLPVACGEIVADDDDDAMDDRGGNRGGDDRSRR